MRAPSEAELVEHEAQLAREGYTVVPGLLDESESDRVLQALRGLHTAQGFGDNEFTGRHPMRAILPDVRARIYAGEHAPKAG